MGHETYSRPSIGVEFEFSSRNPIGYSKVITAHFTSIPRVSISKAGSYLTLGVRRTVGDAFEIQTSNDAQNLSTFLVATNYFIIDYLIEESVLPGTWLYRILNR